MDTERKQDENDAESGDPEPVDPEDAEEVGFFGGSGGPASIIYGEDDEADKHGDRLAHGPDKTSPDETESDES